MFGTIGDLIVVMLGFGAIVFFHELGHFLAARWAGIRVLAFSVGFGPAVLCYRKGIGLTRGSTEGRYRKLLEEAAGPDADSRDRARRMLAAEISPTEYRLSILPLGGYVKMLGQEDLHPDRTSDSSDSYQNCVPWKRLVVISAGVIMNMILAAVLFIVVFMVGLRAESARLGTIDAGSPASIAQPLEADVEPGLKPGDLIARVGDKPIRSFNDLNLAVVMAEPDRPLRMLIQRPGSEQPIAFEVEPQIDPTTRLLQVGVTPAGSTQVLVARSPAERGALLGVFEAVGLGGLEPGMSLVRVAENREPRWSSALAQAARQSGGEPFEAEFRSESAESVIVTIRPEPRYEVGFRATGPSTYTPMEHLLGLAGVMAVGDLGEGASETAREMLRPGDVFIQLGSVPYPTMLEGIAEVRAHAGFDIKAIVLREGEPVTLELPVKRNGTIGFGVGSTAEASTLLGRPLALRDRPLETVEPRATSAADVFDMPGMRLLSIDGRAVTTLHDVWRDLRSRAIATPAGEPLTVSFDAALPLPAGEAEPIIETRTWTITPDEVDRLRELEWGLPFSLGLFEPEMTLLRAGDPFHAIELGLLETKRVMITTYLTFARLFQGTVRIEHLKGPVGIAHLGTQIAKRGWIWVMFFLALISVNLAVINFLPLPIVDGGQFLMILYEMASGKAVPIAVQNLANLAGLIGIGAMFLIVTYNDIMGIFGG